jgi:tetratricopeptide (TPR) repeat protein
MFGALLSAQNQLPSDASRTITYNKDIAPIILSHCANCHRPEQAAPFSLLTYEDVRPRAREIVRAIGTRRMPPWKPEPGHGEFVGARRLSEEQIALIQKWGDDGFLRGDSRDLPPLPRWTTGWQLGDPDLVVAMPEPYTLSAGGSDVFRTFVVPVPITSRRFVRALEFRPGNINVIHHANIKVDRTRFSRRWDENEPGPGYQGGGSREARFPDGHFMGLTPGQSPRVSPRDMAWRLEADSDLVVELHLMRGVKPEQVQFSVGLFFTDQPPTRVPYMLRLGRQDIDIAPGERAYVNADSFTLPVDVQVLGVQPHAHYLAREIRGVATLPDGTTKDLIYIKDWDFRWQDVYTYSSPLALPKGTTLAMRYVYDNSTANPRNPHRPPKRVTFGQTSSSEMGSLWLQVLPKNAVDLQALDRSFSPKMLQDDIAGNEKWLEVESQNALLHAELAACYLEIGRAEEAIAHLESALHLDPTPARHYDLGLALIVERRFDRAKEAFEKALRLKPNFPEAFLNLGVVAHAQGQLDEAMKHYGRARALGLDDGSLNYNMGRALAATGKYVDAIARYRRAVDVQPDDAEARRALGNALFLQQETEEAIAHYRRALTIDPDMPSALVELAWILVRADRAELRNPQDAVGLASHAAELTRFRDPSVLDVLAATYMAANQADRAITTAEAALALASATSDAELIEQLRLRLAFYQGQR